MMDLHHHPLKVSLRAVLHPLVVEAIPQPRQLRAAAVQVVAVAVQMYHQALTPVRKRSLMVIAMFHG